LFAQRYQTTQELAPAPKPFVSALSSTRLHVTWPALEGLNVSHYDLYMDGATAAEGLTTTYWTSGRLDPGSTHYFALVYVLADGGRSASSSVASGTTWGVDENFDGLPDDWQARHWGAAPSGWPPPTADSDGDGANNLQEFLAGTNPADAQSVLRLSWMSTPLGTRLAWNTEPGFVYQVQVSRDLKAWQNLGALRFAPGKQDSISASQEDGSALYRVIRVR
jgi:hypothetical protein